jgi:hypothetical protein
MGRRRESGRSARAWRVRRPLSKHLGGVDGRAVHGAAAVAGQRSCMAHVAGHARLTVEGTWQALCERPRPV